MRSRLELHPLVDGCSCNDNMAVLSLLLLFAATVRLSAATKVGGCVQTRPGAHCKKAASPWQHDGVCIVENDLAECHVPTPRVFKLTLVVKLRKLKKVSGAKPVVDLWARGSGPGLSWDEPLKLQRSARGIDIWKTDISYTSDSQALLCLNTTHCTHNQNALELRVYRDKMGIDDMLGPNFFVSLPVSHSMSGTMEFLAPEVVLMPWFDNRKITVEKFELKFATGAPNAFTTGITILYPPSFHLNTRKSYPLVITFGEKEALYMTPLLEHLYTYEASIIEAVVVAFHHSDPPPFCSLSPFHTEGGNPHSKVWRCKAGENCHECQTCWDSSRRVKCDKNEFVHKAWTCLMEVDCIGKAGRILDLIETDLLPELMTRTQNRIKVDFPHDRMTIIGYDGAGVLACYAALTRPERYRHAACLSAPFHWPITKLTGLEDRRRNGFGRVFSELNTRLQYTPQLLLDYTSQKYYVDVGDKDNFFFPLVDAYNYTRWFVHLLQTILKLKMSENVFYSSVPGAGNSYYHREKVGIEFLNRIKTALVYFLKAEGGPNEKFTRLPKIGETVFAKRRAAMGFTEDLSELEEENPDSDEGDIPSWLNSTQVSSHCPAHITNQGIFSRTVPIPIFLGSIGRYITALYSRALHIIMLVQG